MKTLDGLMAYLARRLTPAQYTRLARHAARQGLGLRDYMGRYVIKMVEAKYEARRAARDNSTIAGVVITATETVREERG